MFGFVPSSEYTARVTRVVVGGARERHQRIVLVSKRACELLNEDLTSPGVQLWDVFPRTDTYSVISVVAGTKKGPKREVEIFRVMVA